MDQALAAVAPQRAAFRSALAVTIDELRSQLDSGQSAEMPRAERVAVKLGRFAAGRIDPESFAELVTETERSDASWNEPAALALEALRDVEARGDDVFRIKVDAGEDLYAAVDAALADAGRAFGAARVVELARTGRYVPSQHDPLLASFPFRRWSRTERAKAPPLVVEVDGGDLLAGALSGFLDGVVKIVLLIGGKAPPAPLVRLVTPGVFVMQTADAGELALAGKAAGPAIAALVPKDAGQFLHEPSEDATRIEVGHLPDEEPGKALGQISAFQQAEELRLLRALATGEPAAASTAAVGSAPTASAASGDGASPAPPPGGPTESVDVLAAWLLRQADLNNLESAGQG